MENPYPAIWLDVGPAIFLLGLGVLGLIKVCKRDERPKQERLESEERFDLLLFILSMIVFVIGLVMFLKAVGYVSHGTFD